MTGTNFSVILLPTIRCNAACRYCFEDRTADDLTLENFALLLRKVVDYVVERDIEILSIYWQGGEVMMLPPEWYAEAYETIIAVADEHGKEIRNYLQSNMLGYDEGWELIIKEMFGGSVGSSMDYPNLYRIMAGGDVDDYDRLWARNVRKAREADIEVGVIALPNPKTLEVGAEAFYAHFVDGLGVTDFQLNMPFPGGARNDVKEAMRLEPEDVGRFLVDLADVWVERGYDRGVKVGPFGELIDYFQDKNPQLPCTWRPNCVTEFVCIDPRGRVSQCDCWVTSYPEFTFGNVFECERFADVLDDSPVRNRMRARPQAVIQQEDCIDCDYLALCHGGCAIRAFTGHGDLLRKDPYCRTYQAVFRHMESMAADLAARVSTEGP